VGVHKPDDVASIENLSINKGIHRSK
jgi:hypothetical protein